MTFRSYLIKDVISKVYRANQNIKLVIVYVTFLVVRHREKDIAIIKKGKTQIM